MLIHQTVGRRPRPRGRSGRRYRIEAGAHRFEADHVVVAMSSHQVPRIPPFAKDLRAVILQMHSSQYGIRNS